ncbi:DUF2271 domain-containing protein [Verrucomicrobiales bacterium BCK34]|nr:DUF2271 domain-containing protein [Verrucomicrobiales bacterium BCK34]
MKTTLFKLLLCAIPTLLLTGSLPVTAGELTAKIVIPELDVAEYHRPYVAVWIETPERELIQHIAVWYDTEMENKEGETWLKDLRQWWRKGGRSLQMPVEAVSGPTKPVGEHEISIPLDSPLLSKLKPGPYFFVVEASREVGGREMQRVPFEWSLTPKIDEEVQGETELGKITLKSNS